jgi:hypothetical protein
MTSESERAWKRHRLGARPNCSFKPTLLQVPSLRSKVLFCSGSCNSAASLKR